MLYRNIDNKRQELKGNLIQLKSFIESELNQMNTLGDKYIPKNIYGYIECSERVKDSMYTLDELLEQEKEMNKKW